MLLTKFLLIFSVRGEYTQKKSTSAHQKRDKIMIENNQNSSYSIAKPFNNSDFCLAITSIIRHCIFLFLIKETGKLP